MKILIDPGHCGKYNKGFSSLYFEGEKMFKLSTYLKQSLERCKIQADLTRSENEDPSLTSRGQKSKGYDLFISEHSNAFDGTVRGVEVYYSVQIPSDKTLASFISKVESTLMGNSDRGAKTRESTTTKNADYYTVMYAARSVNCPHVILVESGFHDNQLDEKFLLDDNNLKKLAETQCKVICEYFNIKYIEETASNLTPIMGNSILTAERLATYLLKNNTKPKINCTAYELAKHFINEGTTENIRGDIAFCQSIHETGWFKYGGQVLPEQNNFCGLGAVNNSATGKGAWFETPQLGIRAQIQHLKAYANKETLKNPCVDPRFNLVTRGIAPNWEDLNGKWAVPGTTYGQNILKIYNNGKNIIADNDLIGNIDIKTAINILVKNNIINSPDYWINNYNKLQYLDMLIINMAIKLK